MKIDAYMYYRDTGNPVVHSIEVEGIHDHIQIEIPDGWEVARSVYEDILIRPIMNDGNYFLIRDILTVNRHRDIWAEWYAAGRKCRQKLRWEVVKA
jgi:hypothetical protein